MMASLLHCLQGCDSSTPSDKDCSLIQSIVQTPWTLPSTLPPHQGTLVTVVDSPLPSDGPDVDCCLTCTSVIPMIIWFIVLVLGLFKSPFHICDRLTDGLPHALSIALLLFHARPWKHPPQLRHSFSSKGPTPSLSAG